MPVKIIRCFFWLISLLPLKVLYLAARIVEFFGYRIIRYRVSVVRSNLKLAFPDKTESERKAIEKKFFRFLFEVLAESTKLFSITSKGLLKIAYVDSHAREIYERFYQTNRNVLIMMPHYGNWELGNLLAQVEFNAQVKNVYKPLRNKIADQLFLTLRTRFGGEMVPMKGVLRSVLSSKNQTHVLSLIADQNASRDNATFIEFFGKKIPFFSGAEFIARKANYAVVFAYFDRDSKGKWVLHTEIISEAPNQMNPGEIITQFAKRTEALISNKPELWLWSHNRWKNAIN